MKVRIALEINSLGEWQAFGCTDTDGEDWASVTDGLDGLECVQGHHVQRYWIDAEVPVPADEPTAVTGETVPA